MKKNFIHVLLICCLCVGSATAAEAWQRSINCIEGNGTLKSQQRSLNDYHKVAVQGAYTLHITCGGDYKCTISGDSNLLEHVVTVVEKGKLRIGNDSSLCMQQPLNITLQVPLLDSFYAEGAHDITISSIKGDLFDFEMDGSCVAQVDGAVSKLEIEIRGNSVLDAQQLTAGSVNVDAAGTSSAKIQVNGPLHVSAAGIAEILYSGKPTEITTNLSGLAEVDEVR